MIIISETRTHRGRVSVWHNKVVDMTPPARCILLHCISDRIQTCLPATEYSPANNSISQQITIAELAYDAYFTEAYSSFNGNSRTSDKCYIAASTAYVTVNIHSIT